MVIDHRQVIYHMDCVELASFLAQFTGDASYGADNPYILAKVMRIAGNIDITGSRGQGKQLFGAGQHTSIAGTAFFHIYYR